MPTPDSPSITTTAPSSVDPAVRVDDVAELAATADQRQLVRLRDRLGDRRLGLDLRPGTDRAIELGRLGQRLHAELAAQHADAVAVLRERVAAAAGTGVQLDQAPVRRLVQPVEVEALARPRDGVVEASLALEPLDQPVERGRTLAAQRVLRESLPVVEVDAVAQAEAGEQVVAMQVARRDQRLCGRVRVVRQPAELPDVEPGIRQVEADRVAIALEPSLAERRAQCRERSPQRGPGALRVGVRPEQVRDHGSRVRVPADREIGEHRRGLARVDRQRAPVHLDARRPEK